MIKFTSWKKCVRPSLETNDLLQLLVAVVLVPITWLILLEWNGADSIAAQDALSMHYPALKDFVARNGDWTRILYRPQIFGGVAIHDMGLLYLPFTLFTKLGLTPLQVLNFTWLLIQIAFSLVTSRLAIDLVGMFEERPQGELVSFNIFYRAALTWLTAFAPIVGWRLSYGHLNLILGSLLFIVGMALLLAIARGTLTWVFAAISATVAWTLFPSAGQQMVVYSVVFGVPLLLCFAWPHRHLLRKIEIRYTFAAIVLIVLGAMGVGMLRYAGILHLPFSGELSRGFGESAVYSFQTISLHALVSSFFWSRSLTGTGFNQGYIHEFQLTVGPILLLLVFFAWKKMKLFSVALIAMLVVFLLFSFRVEPVASLLSHRYSPLSAFRCPHRSLFLLFLLIPPFASAAFLSRFYFATEKLEMRAVVVFIFIGGLSFFISSTIREAIAWAVVSAIVWSGISRRKQDWLAPAFFLLAILSVSAFKERLLPFAPQDTIENRNGQIPPEIIRLPHFRNPLYRTVFEIKHYGFSENLAYAIGASTVNGYWYPSARFFRLASAISETPLGSMSQLVHFPVQSKRMESFRILYNVTTEVGFSAQKNIVAAGLGPTAGPAWFSAMIERVPSYSELASRLRGDNLLAQLKNVAYLTQDDPLVARTILPDVNCKDASLQEMQIHDGGQKFIIALQTPSACPLTVSTNYFSHFAGSAKMKDGSIQVIPTFPSYGALLATLVPANATSVLLEAKPYCPTWAWLAFFAGLTCWITAALCLARSQYMISSVP